MSYFFVAQIKINDFDEYKKYVDNSGDVFKKYKGEYLAVDNNPAILEGNWEYSRAVIIKFENSDDFYEWYNSPEYQEILKHRLVAADCDTILVKGI